MAEPIDLDAYFGKEKKKDEQKMDSHRRKTNISEKKLSLLAGAVHQNSSHGGLSEAHLGMHIYIYMEKT